MGKTAKPLRIFIHSNLRDWEEIRNLAAQGHVVQVLPDGGDLILGPTCWRMDQDHRKYVGIAVAASRRQRYSKGE